MTAAQDDVDTLLDVTDAKALRRAFGAFGTGVTIVTTMTPRGPLAMTANSFSSVSLSPPLVLWSAACNSLRHDSFAQAEHFIIHILAENQKAQALHFASQGHDFAQIEWITGANGAPEIPGGVATLHCNGYAAHPAGDHSVIIGEVTHARVSDSGAQGLMFAKGQFGCFEPET